MNHSVLVKAIRWLSHSVFVLTLESEDITKIAQPGQFIQVKTHFLLRRPFAIMSIDGNTNTFEIGIQLVGQGTRELSQVNVGDVLDILGPLGNSYAFDCDRVIAVGGGSGVFPLLFLAQRAKSQGKRVTSILGFSSAERVILKEEFQAQADHLVIACEESGFDYTGFAPDALKSYLLELSEQERSQSKLFSCGPIPMLKRVVEVAQEFNLASEVSLEVRMGCGFGVCRGCPVDLYEGTSIKRVRCCVEGPVFPGDRVVFESLLGERIEGAVYE